MGWRDKLADAGQLAASGADRARQAVVDSEAIPPRLRAILDINDDQPLTAEALLLLIVDAVHKDEPRELSEKDVKKAGKRRQRLATAAGLTGGPVGLTIANLYCEAAVLCDVVDLHGLALTDEEIAAHLLVLWNAVADFDAGRQAIDGTGLSVMAHVGLRMQQQLHERVTDKPIGEMTKTDIVKALWRLRGVAGDVAIPEDGGPKDLFLPGGRVKAITEAAERQLGIVAA